MSHCVGGYGGQVRNGSCRIFKIRVGEEKATLELRSALKIDQEGEEAQFVYSIRQLRGIRNQDPHEDIKKIVNAFLQDLNKGCRD